MVSAGSFAEHEPPLGDLYDPGYNLNVAFRKASPVGDVPSAGSSATTQASMRASHGIAESQRLEPRAILALAELGLLMI